MDIATVLHNLASPERAQSAQRFFKTGSGQYGEGDIFIGISVPQLRAVAKQFKDASLDEIKMLLESPIHEFRMTGLFILKHHYAQAKKNKNLRKQLIEFYLLFSTTAANNWDLVDCSADIVGNYLLETSESQTIDITLLKELAHSKNLWQQRIAIVATMPLIRAGIFQPTFSIAKILIKHKHDLIHKAVGWMLREVGKKNREEEERFLKEYYHAMPRTMLRYALEHFSEERRKAYLSGKI